MTIFTRQTVGVYVSLTFVGAGVGLLVGSFVAAFVEQRRVNKVLDELNSTVNREERANLVRQLGYLNDELGVELEEYENVKLVNEEEQTEESTDAETARAGTSLIHQQGRGNRHGTRAGSPTRSRTDYSGRSKVDSGSDPGTGGETSETSGEEGGVIGPEERSRFAKLAARYTISQQQEKLFWGGFITLDDLEAGLEYESDLPPWDDKPDLDDLVDDEDERLGPDPNFEVLIELPNGVWNIIELGYYEDTDTMVKVSKDGRYVRVNDPDVLLGDSTLDTVLEVLGLAPATPVYVYDHTSEKIYSVSIFVDETPQPKKKYVRTNGRLTDDS